MFNTQNPNLIAKFNLTLTLIQLVVVLLCFQGECVLASQTPLPTVQAWYMSMTETYMWMPYRRPPDS